MSNYQIPVKRLHSGQLQVMADAKRYNVLKIGRRFGKTTMSVNNLIIRPALEGFPVAYYAPTYKDLDEVWQELKTMLMPIISGKNEQTKQLRLISGGLIDCWSLDNPDSGRGRKYKRVVIDEVEKSKKFKEAWQGAIMPTLLDYKGDAWLLSTPKFGDTYFKELHKRGGESGWAAFNLSTYDNPHIDRDEIDELRKQLDDLSFRCEILAEDVDLAYNPFAYAFSADRHVRPVQFDKNQTLYLSFDFNVDPITCIAVQSTGVAIHVVREFALPNSDIYALCDQIVSAYPTASFVITGDSTGANRTAVTQGNLGYYDVVRNKLRLGNAQMKQPRMNPSVRDTRVLLNSLLQNHTVLIDPSCTGLIRDLKYVEVDGEGDIKKDRSTENKKADLLDCLRYYLYTFHSDFIRFFL
jgi:hypothetical protein